MNAVTRLKAPFLHVHSYLRVHAIKARDEGWLIIINFTIILRLFFIIYWEASNLNIQLNCMRNEGDKLYVVVVRCKTNSGFNLKSAFFSVTEREVAHGPKNDYPHISLRDTQWWVNNSGIFVLFWSTFAFQKIRQIRKRSRPLQKWRTLVPQIWTQELCSRKVQKQGRLSFSSICIVYLCAKYWHIIYAETQDFSSNFEFTAGV